MSVDLKKKLTIVKWAVAAFFVAVILITVLSPVAISWKRNYAKRYYAEAQAWEQVYCYDTLVKGLNHAYYADDPEEGLLISEFYTRKTSGENIPIKFPIQGLQFQRRVFVKELDVDSDVALVVDFDTTCWGYLEAYVSKQTISKSPPSPTLLANWKEFWARYEASEEGARSRMIKQKRNCISEYGIQCDCN
jgi:hypothetical protein